MSPIRDSNTLHDTTGIPASMKKKLLPPHQISHPTSKQYTPRPQTRKKKNINPSCPPLIAHSSIHTERIYTLLRGLAGAREPGFINFPFLLYIHLLGGLGVAAGLDCPPITRLGFHSGHALRVIELGPPGPAAPAAGLISSDSGSPREVSHLLLGGPGVGVGRVCLIVVWGGGCNRCFRAGLGGV